MSKQNEFSFGPLVDPCLGKGATIAERFDAFHKENPWVLTALVDLARRYQRMGRGHVGIKHLVEVIRWEYAKGTRGDEFKMNNNFTSRYARLICDRHPDMKDLFELRVLRAA